MPIASNKSERYFSLFNNRVEESILKTVPLPRPGIKTITAHMVDLPAPAEALKVINLGGNENPLGPSVMAIEAAQRAASEMHRYLEVDESPLKNEIGRCFHLDPRNVVCGPGSDEILARLATGYLGPGDELIYSLNGYSKFSKYAYIAGAKPIAALDDDYRPDVDAILGAVNQNTRMVMIANPDNPSGRFVAADEITRLHQGLPDDVLLVLDSAYAEYVDNPDYEVPTALIEQYSNVVMTRTFSKLFACAGGRLGWLYGPAPIVATLNRIQTNYPLSNMTMAAGIMALADHEHIRRSLEHNKKWRAWLKGQLEDLGLFVYPSETNFLLVRFEDSERSAREACQHLLRSGIVTARFHGSDFENLLRFSVGLEDELRAVIVSLRDFFEQ